jgi:hypothetical protein
MTINIIQWSSVFHLNDFLRRFVKNLIILMTQGTMVSLLPQSQFFSFFVLISWIFFALLKMPFISRCRFLISRPLLIHSWASYGQKSKAHFTLNLCSIFVSLTELLAACFSSELQQWLGLATLLTQEGSLLSPFFLAQSAFSLHFEAF